MNSFTFLCRTKTCFGLNALENMPFDLAAMGCRKPMIIQDRSARLFRCRQNYCPGIQGFGNDPGYQSSHTGTG